MDSNHEKLKIPLSGWLALALLMGVALLLSWHTLTSIYQDIGRHLTIGRIIWQTHEVPRTNLFSYSTPDFPFVNHHWFGELLLYLGERVVGLKGLIAVKAVMFTGAFLLAFSAAWRRSILVPSLIVGITGLFIVAERTDVRPEILSFLFLGWFLFVLYRQDAKREAQSLKLLWTLPFVQLLWVNSHIYFFMGPFLFLAFAVQRLVEMSNDKFLMSNEKSGHIVRHSSLGIRHLLLLGGALAAAMLLNPWFLRGALYPFTIFGNYGYSIVENKSYFFLRAFGYPSFTFTAVIVGLLMYLISLGLNKHRFRENVMGLMLVAGTMILALMMVRNFPLFGLVMIPATLQNLAQTDIRWPLRGTVVAGALLVLLSLSILQGQFFGRLGTVSRQFGLVVPEGHQKAVDFFREHKIEGPIFNNFDIGSYLIWKLPEEPVFIDGRPEAYPAEFIQETYIRAQERPERWQEVSGLYQFNAIFWNTRDITPWSRTFMERIQNDADWALVYLEDGIALLVKRSGTNDTIPAILQEAP